MTDIGAKIGIHTIRMNNETMTIIQEAANRGVTFPILKAVDDVGWLNEAKALMPKAITVARFITQWDGLQNINSSNIQEFCDNIMGNLELKISQNPGLLVDYFEIINEPDPPSVQGYADMANLMILCMQRANQMGVKIAIFSLNAGTPEYNEIEAMVATGVFGVAKAGGHILMLHEGVFGDDAPIDQYFPGTLPGYPPSRPAPNPQAGALCFRHRFIYDLLEERNEVIPLVLSEFYYGGGYTDVDDIQQRAIWYDEEAVQSWYVLAVLPYTLGPIGQWHTQNYEPAYGKLIDYMVSVKDRQNATEPDGTPPPPPPPPPVGNVNLLANPSFEEGWWHYHVTEDGQYLPPDEVPSGVQSWAVPELQLPNNWGFMWKGEEFGTEENHLVPSQPWIRPETRVWPKSQAPDGNITWSDGRYADMSERDLFFLDGDFCVKIFKGNGSVNWELWQVRNEESGEYLFKVRLFPDLVSEYVNGKKVWATDQAGEIRFVIDGVQYDWIDVVSGEWNEFTQIINHAGGNIQIGIKVRGRWAIQNNGWFMDDWDFSKTTEPIEPPPPPPPPPPTDPDCARDYKVTYFLSPQTVGSDARAIISEWIWAGLDGELVQMPTGQNVLNSTYGKHVLTYSHEDGFDSVVQGQTGSVLYIVNPEMIGTGITWAWLADNYPEVVERVRFVWTNPTPELEFQLPIREPYVVTSRLNDPRDYNNDGVYDELHEGIDVVAQGDQNIYAIESGIVERVKQPPYANYGLYVRVRHESSTDTYKSWYCHLKESYVSEGDHVMKGQAIAKQGATGNVSGLHLHLTLQHIGNGMDGYVIDDIVDPEDYMDFQNPPPPPPPPTGYHGVPVTYKGGIHGPGSDWKWSDPPFKSMMQQLNLPVLYLSNGVNVNHADWDGIVRMFPSIDPNNILTPQEMWNELKLQVQPFWNRGFRKFIPFNEVNLPGEGWGDYWNNPQEFATYLNQFLQLVKNDYPTMKIYHTPMSPQSGPWGTQEDWYNASWAINKNLCYGFAIHAYTSPANGIDGCINDIVNQTLTKQQQYALGHPLVVTESSVNRVASAEFKAQVYKGIDNLLKTKAGIEGVYWYISHWVNDPNGENWLGTDVPTLYKS